MALAGNNEKRASRSAAAVAVVCVSQFLVTLDVTIVTTALPAIGDALRLDGWQLQWVVTAYALALGSLLVCGGRAADVIGRRRALVLGLAVFGAASLACAFASSALALIVARIVQGFGAALLSPSALALLSDVTQPGEQRRRALGWWTAAAAGGGATGWVASGLLVTSLGWPSVFGAAVPITGFLLIVAPLVLPAKANAVSRGKRRQLDVLGAASVVAALGLSVAGLTAVSDGMFLEAVPLLSSGALSAVVFLAHERRTHDPLFPLSLFAVPETARGVLAAVLLNAAATPAMFLAMVFAQNELDLSPERAALLFPVFNLTIVGGSLLAPRLIRLFGDRPVLVAGSIVLATGISLLALPLGRSVGAVTLIAGFAVMGAGSAVAQVASTEAATVHIGETYRGAAAGVLNSAMQIGSAVGLAGIVPIALGNSAAGYAAGFLASSLVAVAAGLAAIMLRRRSTEGHGNRRRDQRAPAERLRP